MTSITLNGEKYESREVLLDGKHYKLFAHGSIEADNYPLVEVFICESGIGQAHWRRLRSGPTKEAVIRLARVGVQIKTPAFMARVQ